MTITHSYDLTGVTTRPTDQQINDFINSYQFVFPILNNGTQLLMLGSNYPISAEYQSSIDSFVISGSELFLMPANGTVSSKGSELIYNNMSVRKSFTTEIGQPNTAGVYYTLIKVGDQLTQPEAGWKRYDDTHPAIKYEGDWGTWGDISSSSIFYFGGGTKASNITGSKYSFKFIGTKIRIIDATSNNRSSEAKVTIDNQIETYSSLGTTPVGSSDTQKLAYEKIDLDFGVHIVTVEVPDSNYVGIDAIDIDEDGMLLHPDEVTDIEDLEIGKRIRCHYSASQNTVGMFSRLGEEVYIDGINDFIPPEGSPTPNGCFYAIMGGYEYDGRPKLIADRNIQTQISWDTLNSEGIASGSGVVLPESGLEVRKLPNPSQLPTGNGYGTAFSPDGSYLSVAHTNSPYLTIYKRDGDTFTKLPNPSHLPTGTGNGTAFSPDGNYLSVSHSTTPYLTIYKRNGDTFTKLPDPSQLLTGSGRGTSFSPDGNYLSVAHYTSPFITIYKRNGDTFTKLPNPSQLPTGVGNGTAFSPDGNYLSVAHTSSPFITIYKRDGDTFTKLPNPSQLPTGNGRGTAFSPDGNYLSVVHNTSPFITIYKRDGDTFTKLPNPSQLPPNVGYGTAFSPDGNYLSVAYGASPFITIYKRDGDTFTKLPNPSQLPTGTGYGTSFSPDGNYLSVAHYTLPFITIYKISNLNLYQDGDVSVATRLLTGGVNNTDKENEWDRYIVNSPLSGDVWNTVGITSWTSTTPSNNAVNRVVRGNSAIDTWSHLASSTVNATTGFRPVLLIESLINPPQFTGGVDRTETHKEAVMLTGTIDHDKEVRYRVLVNSVEIKPYTSFTAPPIDINETITYDLLTVGSNTVIVEMEDEEGVIGRATYNLTQTNEEPYGEFYICCNEITRQDVVVRGIISNLEGGWKKLEDWDGEGEVFIKPYVKGMR